MKEERGNEEDNENSRGNMERKDVRTGRIEIRLDVITGKIEEHEEHNIEREESKWI